MEGHLSLTLVEIVILMSGAIFLGMTVHFVISSRMGLKVPVKNNREDQLARDVDSWKSRFFQETQIREKEIDRLKRQLAEEEENTQIYTIEAEEVRKENKELKQQLREMESRPATPVGAAFTGDPNSMLLAQLQETRDLLAVQQEQFTRLLREATSAQQNAGNLEEWRERAEGLELKVEELELQLQKRDEQLAALGQQQQIGSQMSTLLNDAYGEFSQLQERIRQLESQLMTDKKAYIQYEDLQEACRRAQDDLEEMKQQAGAWQSEHQRLQEELREAQTAIEKESRENQQLRNRLLHYESLDQDLKAMSDSNKKLAAQLKRLGELESMLNMLAEENARTGGTR